MPSLADEPKRVLIVHSFGSVAPPFTTGSTAFQAELVKQMGNRVDLDEVSLGVARYAEPEMQEAVDGYRHVRAGAPPGRDAGSHLFGLSGSINCCFDLCGIFNECDPQPRAGGRGINFGAQ